MLTAVLDIETQEPIPESRDIKGMRVSVAGAIADGAVRFYGEDEMQALFKLLDEADLIVGHNLIGFDYIVLQRYADFAIAERYRGKTFDILRVLERKTDRRISLNDLAQRNLGRTKLGKGIDAPRLFKEGKLDELKAYLEQDLRLTDDLFEFIRQHGELKYGLLTYKEPVERTVRIGIDER